VGPPLQLGFSHYLGAVKGYRLAKYWLNQNPDMSNHPDVQFGIREAQFGIREAKEKGQKAAITLEATMSEFQAQGNMQGAHECEEMLGYVNNLLNTVQNGNVQGTQPGLPNQDSYPQGSRPWRAPYGGQ
jgi:hypothetical protein